MRPDIFLKTDLKKTFAASINCLLFWQEDSIALFLLLLPPSLHNVQLVVSLKMKKLFLHKLFDHQYPKRREDSCGIKIQTPSK